jgi:hypothetical protein
VKVQRYFADCSQLITKLRKDRKNKLLPLRDKVLFRKRSLRETVNDQFKHIAKIEHSRYRRVATFLVNLVAGVIASTCQAKQPSLHSRMPQNEPLSVVLL